jgi:hypothetical protein
MRELGWAPVGDGSLKILAAHTYRRNDDQGRPWTGTLFSIAVPDSSQQDVTLRISRSQTAGAK